MGKQGPHLAAATTSSWFVGDVSFQEAASLISTSDMRRIAAHSKGETKPQNGQKVTWLYLRS